MLQSVIEELEVILNETNEVKQHLDDICEHVWYLLSPPGSRGCGTIILKKICNSTNKKPSSYVSSDVKESSPLENVLGNVSDLIAYGKHVRETASLDKVNKIKTDKGDTDKNPIHPCESITSVQQKAQKTDKRNSKCNLSVKSKHTIQNLRANTVCKEKQKTTNTHKIEKDNVKLTAGFKSYSNAISNKYVHSCSMNLTQTINTFKMPTDLLYLLKLKHKFENIRQEKNYNADNFSEKFYSYVSK